MNRNLQKWLDGKEPERVQAYQDFWVLLSLTSAMIRPKLKTKNEKALWNAFGKALGQFIGGETAVQINLGEALARRDRGIDRDNLKRNADIVSKRKADQRKWSYAALVQHVKETYHEELTREAIRKICKKSGVNY
jgi:hypothetical protein